MKFVFPVFLILFLASCVNSSKVKDGVDTAKKQASTPPQKQDIKSSAPVSEELMAFTRFIGGMEYTNPLKKTESKAWQSFSVGNNEKWDVLTNRIGGKISGWLKTNPQEIKNEPSTLFYPFAGGDFYYANLFFPNQDTIIMIGLEPGGSIFNPSGQPDSLLGKYYNNLQHTMFFPHRLGFFRTKSMADDFNHGPLNGTLHTVLFYIARFGFNVHYISHFNLDSLGNEEKIVDGTMATGKVKRTGYKVGYSIPGTQRVKEVIYMSYDASDGYLKKHNALVHFLEKRNKVVTFFKAASYLMHEEYFSIIRNYVSAHTVRLMQDDSGLPYKFMQDNGFKITLLGEYKRTIKLFAGRFQPDLKSAYENKAPEKLPFMIGYNAEFNECNLQAAVKK